jgi:hypothetical protein
VPNAIVSAGAADLKSSCCPGIAMSRICESGPGIMDLGGPLIADARGEMRRLTYVNWKAGAQLQKPVRMPGFCRIGRLCDSG